MHTPDRFARVHRVLDRRVEEGRFPGYVAALRHDGRVEVLAGGRRHRAMASR